MSGLFATVLLSSPFTPADSGRVTELLRRLVDDVTDTRKGRHWEFSYLDARASVSVVDTAKHDYDFEGVLLDRGLLFDDAPEAFVLDFGVSRDCDREMCASLASCLADEFGGINCGFVG